MLTATPVFAAAIGYVLALFALAYWGDHRGRRLLVGKTRTLVYALSLAVYCTSWTYYGSVGAASSHGFDFLPIYIGPVLVIGFGHRLVRRIIDLSRAQNLTTVADFVSARYGKSQIVASLSAFIVLMAAAPYMALQLKAITQTMLLVTSAPGGLSAPAPSPGFSVAVAAILAIFAMAFGTRRLNPAERQDGLMLAVAAESVVKLLAFLAVGAFAVWGFCGGVPALAQAAARPDFLAPLLRAPDPANWLAVTALSASAALLLPRQFHVTVVENAEARDVKAAAWLFPLYLVAINLFVPALALAGLALFPAGADRDLSVLALPLRAGAPWLALTTMIGGVSASTAMVVVESVALAITVSNDLVMPVWLRRRASAARAAEGEIGALVLNVRRAVILGVMALGFAYARYASDAALAEIGLLSFAAVAQIAPAFLGGLIWRRGTARGAAAGLAVGSLAWLYLLFAPSLAAAPLSGPLGIAALRPAALTAFASTPFVGGVALSLGLNLLAFALVSLTRQPTLLERTQAAAFVGDGPLAKSQAFRLWRASATVGDVEATVARFIGAARARRSFDALFAERGLEKQASAEADASVIRHAEHLLSPVIGASTSRLVLSLLLRRRAMSGESALKMLDDASAAMQSSRDLLQHALDHARQGISVFGSNLELRAWNRAFAELFDLPPAMLREGLGLDAVVRFNAGRGLYGPGASDDFVAERIAALLDRDEPTRLRLPGRVLEVRSARLPDGGIVTTYADISQTVAFEDELAAANEGLERRVGERTAELERLNRELARAKTAAEEANLSKTRFLAAAGHDILQPLNAARLYASSLVEAGPQESASLARNVDASLEAVEEILGALLDISRLDAGATKPEVGDVALADLFPQLEIEFAPAARAKGLRLSFVATGLAVRSDRRLLRRLLQNFVSNAVKYTPRGRVLVGARRRGETVRVEVWDTGLGIPESQRAAVFEEFQRLDQGAKVARGLGLGLSIVQRLGRVLGHPIGLRSQHGRGSVFSVTAPLSRAPALRAPGAPAPAAAALDPLDGLRVLAIDNEPRVLDGLRSLLSRWGCEVATASGLGEALTKLDPPPDIVVADYHLDDGDGLAAIAAVRARLKGALPAVLATADRSADVRDACAAADVALLNKPVKPAPLRALLTRGLSLRAAAE
jgi:Na+/proline symporter/signal transduction histidine kinase